MADTISVQTGAPALVATPIIPDNVAVRQDGGRLETQVTKEPAKDAVTLGTEPRPQWLPDNFKKPEDLVKSYQESVKELTKTKQEVATLKKATASSELTGSAPTAEKSATDTTTTSVTPGPLDLPGLASEWAANGGKLTDASLGRLEKSGINRSDVEQFIAGQQALAAQHTESLARVAGGREQLQDVLEWYAQGGSKAEASQYNKALAEGRFDDARLVLTNMVNTYRDRVGRDPRVLVKGEIASGAKNEAPFMNFGEVTRAMNDPRYKTDLTYRRSVERRTMAMQRQS